MQIDPTIAPESARGVRDAKRLHPYREPVAPRPAATVLLLRPREGGFDVLMTRRSLTASFVPGAYVFPGGAFDQSDAGIQARRMSRARPTQDEVQRAFAVTAIRESFEELGILLAYRPDGSLATDQDARWFDRAHTADFCGQLEEAGYTLAVDRVHYLCHWITDRDLPKRFDVRFLVAMVPPGQTPIADENEQFEPVWVSPADALARYAAGNFSIIFPTERTLRRIAAYPDADSVIAACASEKPLFVSSPRGGYLRGEIERFDERDMAFGELELVTPDGQVLHHLDWRYDRPVPLLKNVIRLTCPNPGMMTGPGTNTYIVGEPGAYAVIDPGPADAEHVARIAAIVGPDLKAILCTHAHSDHSPGAFLLQKLIDAPILGRPWGPRTRTYGNDPDAAAEDLRDPAFMPDRVMEHGERLALGDSTLRAVFTPGHASNHLCFLLEEDGLLFSGDHINNGQTVVINPPDGNMNEYLRALRELRELPLTYILPAHGHVIGFARQAIDQLIAHRQAREAKVLNAVRQQRTATIDSLLPIVYGDVDQRLYPVASRSLLASLEKLDEDGVITRSGDRWLAGSEA
ncbi:MAG: MBL fold metallo-hydrolase [Burkholderiaceae bacterium]